MFSNFLPLDELQAAEAAEALLHTAEAKDADGAPQEHKPVSKYTHWRHFISLASHCERLMDEFLPTNGLSAINEVKQLLQLPSLNGHAKKGLLAAAAVAIDYSSAAHKDDDFFFLFLMSKVAETTKCFNDAVAVNLHPAPAPVHHFVFP